MGYFDYIQRKTHDYYPCLPCLRDIAPSVGDNVNLAHCKQHKQLQFCGSCELFFIIKTMTNSILRKHAELTEYNESLALFFVLLKNQRHTIQAEHIHESVSVNAAQGLLVTAHKVWPDRIFL